LPDRLSPYAPQLGGHGIRRKASELGFERPVLWVNNHSLARFATRTGWPIVYDITDDWLLVDTGAARHRRAKLDDELLLESAETVTVCSSVLAASRRSSRPVIVIPNGVDPLRFATLTPRPGDLPEGPTAVYVGTLHDERLDVPLSCRLADELPEVQFVFVGPDSLQARSSALLQQRPNVHLLGVRDHDDVPSYYQHADVLIVPHLVSPFTESLDPIKAREVLAVGAPTVSTPIAGFRHLGPPIRIADPRQFSQAVTEALRDPRRQTPPPDLITWADVAVQFGDVLEAAARGPSRSGPRRRLARLPVTDIANCTRPRVAFLTSADIVGEGGINRYTSELLGELIRRDDIELVPVTSQTGAARLRQRFPDLKGVIVLEGGSVMGRSLRERYLLGRQLRRAKVDLVHATKHIIPRNAGCPTILTAYDLFMFTRGSDYHLSKRMLLPAVYRRSLAEADRVIALSRAVRQQLVDKRMVAGERVDVVPAAPASALMAADAEVVPSLAHRFFALCVCDLSPHKNIELLLRIWEEVHRRTGLVLAILGPNRARSSRLRSRLKDLEQAGLVIHPGFVSNGAVRWCYEQAAMVLVPSLEEGFGLPAVEALQFGAKVITSSDPALVEVSGVGTRHIDPDDDKAWVDAIVEVHEGAKNALSDHLVSWHEVADLTVDVYRRALLEVGPAAPSLGVRGRLSALLSGQHARFGRSRTGRRLRATGSSQQIPRLR
jgi:glycosyltransferase involved in cell wall biosynthesis